MRWVSLHSHTTFSFGDGYGPVEDHVRRVAELGMTALAVTEHGSVSSHVQLEKACEKHGVKPIYGCEVYEAPPKHQRKYHQIFLAMDAHGYQNLNRMVSQAQTPADFYYWPTVSWDNLNKHQEGLIATSGCADSLLSCTLLGGKNLGEKRLEYTDEQFDAALRLAAKYKEIFGDRYYLEVQRFPGLERACVLNPAFERIGRELGIPLLGTADVHYPNPKDNEMQKILHAATRGGTVEKVEAGWEYDILLTYPQSDREIYDDLRGTGLSKRGAEEALENTAIVAERCTVELPKNEPIRFPYPKDKFSDIESYLRSELNKGWKFRGATNKFMQSDPDRYKERVAYELERIIPKGFCDYFAMLSDAVIYAKEQKIPVGPARGSAAASLVCYLLRITEVDPLQHPHMLFERFIDPSRIDLPDVDLDFADDRRHEVRAYLVRRYGADRVGNIANFVRYRGKNSIDDVARVYNIPKWEADTVKELIIERSGGDSRLNDSLADTFESFSKARDVLSRYPEMGHAIALEGNYRGMNVHAAGMVISNSPITDTCAIYTRKVKGREQTVLAYDKKDSEYVGMLKADFLGLSTMGMVGLALDTIGMDLEDLYRIPLDEPDTLAAFKRNDVTGIFQFEGRATRLVCADVSPDHFQHLADINALSRPGPLFSGMTAQYCEVKHGRAEPESLHPAVDAYTDWTNGQIVYQEQVLSIIKDIGGFPMGRVHDIRKIISSKLGEQEFDKMYAEFEAGAMRLHGIKPELALRIWRFMSTSATYSFNIAHCISYSMLAFWQMWIKVHHPTAFYAAQLTKVGDGKNKLYKRGKLMQDAIQHGVKIGPPDINRSGATWTADLIEGEVIAGFEQVHGIGEKTAINILDYIARRDAEDMPDENGQLPGLDWADLIEVKGIGAKTIEKIEDFVAKPDPFDLSLVTDTLNYYRRLIEEGAIPCPRPTHKGDEIPRQGEHQITWMGIPHEIDMKDYIEDQRARTGKSLEEITAEMRDPHLTKSCVIRCHDDSNEDVYLRINRWQYPKFKDAVEELNIGSDIVVVKGLKRDDFGVSLHIKSMTVIDPTDDEEDEAETEEVEVSV